MPVLCDSRVYPSGLAEATNCAPTCPAAPALASTTTGCLRIGSMAAASGRVTRSLMPPGGNALMMVMACEGKVSCANAGPTASAVAAVPMTKRRRSMCCLLEPELPDDSQNRREYSRMCSCPARRAHIRLGPRRVRLVQDRIRSDRIRSRARLVGPKVDILPSLPVSPSMLYSALREAVSSITISYYRVAGHEQEADRCRDRAAPSGYSASLAARIDR